MKQKRIFSGITAASLVLSMVGQFSVCAAEQVPEKEEKQYIIVAENVIKIKKYANDNGYTASVLSQATIANPIIPQ